MINLRRLFLVILVCGVSLWPVTVSFPETKSQPTPPPEITPAAIQSIERGLEYFARRQMRNGAIESSYTIANSALAGLGWLAAGHTPHRGKYSQNLRKVINYLLESQQKNGYICGTDSQSGMYGHGFSTLLLSESFGMIEDETVYEKARTGLKKAVKLLESTQNRYGGWNSAPDANATDDGSGAVAIMQITALRAARNAGVAVNPETISRAKKYLLEMTTEDGWYQYNYHGRTGGHRSSALTGAGMYMFGAFDLYNESKYRKGIQNLLNSAPFLGKHSGDSGWGYWYYYTAFYSSLAIFQYGGETWTKWYPPLRDELIKRQQADGLWSGDGYGGVYSAFAILTLTLPYRYLPIFQEGGKGAEGK